MRKSLGQQKPFNGDLIKDLGIYEVVNTHL